MLIDDNDLSSVQKRGRLEHIGFGNERQENDQWHRETKHSRSR